MNSWPIVAAALRVMMETRASGWREMKLQAGGQVNGRWIGGNLTTPALISPATAGASAQLCLQHCVAHSACPWQHRQPAAAQRG